MSFTPASKALARFKVLDLTRARAGPTAARQFADWGADVIKIELPRGLDESDMGGPRHGPDFQSLHLNKRIVYGSISGFGEDGPYRERPGFDQIAQGMGGLMSITGLPGQGPVRVGIPVAD